MNIPLRGILMLAAAICTATACGRNNTPTPRTSAGNGDGRPVVAAPASVPGASSR